MSDNMPIDELLAINSLLIKRESELSQLSQIESSVSKILGQSFPFERPKTPLPSTQKRKATRARSRPKTKKPKKIRRLKPGEIAYRVTTIENGERRTQDLVDASPLQVLLTAPLPNHRIQSVHTIGEDLSIAETLVG